MKTPSKKTPSKQGEHVFNALGDLASEFVTLLSGKIAKNPSDDANKAIKNLKTKADQLKCHRDDASFRTAPEGDPANSFRYSQFAQKTRTAVNNIISGNPSLHTLGYIEANKLLDDLHYYTVDETACHASKSQLSPKHKKSFDTWYQETELLMHETYESLIDAALAVNRAINQP